jgi:hypothetical protein
MYISIHTYAFMYIYVYIFIYTFIYMFTCLFTCIYEHSSNKYENHLFLFIYIQVDLCVYIYNFQHVLRYRPKKSVPIVISEDGNNDQVKEVLLYIYLYICI